MMARSLKTLRQLAGGKAKTRKGRFLTVDIDSRHLYLALAEHVRGKTRFHRLAMEPLNDETRLDDPVAVGRAIRRAAKRHKMQAKGMVMHLRRAQVVLKPMVLPRPDSAFELAQMVRFQISKDLSLEPGETVIDYAIETHVETEGEGEESGGLEVLAAAVRHSIVEFARAVAQEARLKLFRLGLRPYADMFGALNARMDTTPEALALVHLTADETEVSVFHGDTLAFSRACVTRLHGRPEKAQGDATQETKATSGAADAAVLEAARSLQSFQAVQRDRSRPIGTILVAGGTGFEAEVADKLTTRLGVPSQVFEPSEQVLIRRKPDESLSGFISCIGLAVSERDVYRQPLNFDRPKNPKAPLNIKRVRRIAIGVAAAILLFAGVGYAINERITLTRERDRLTTMVAQQREPVREAARQVRRVESLNRWTESAEPWVGHLALISSAFPDAELAYINSFTTQSNRRVNFQLSSRDSTVADRIEQALRELGYDVVAGRTSQPDQEGYSHVIDMTLTAGDVEKVDLAERTAQPRRENDLFRPGNEREAEEFLSNPRGGARPGAARPGGGQPTIRRGGTR
ncbi:MAG: pilus assembly protein PilM [Phycisphaeraceae bacterium]|nr:pilus assembly protein PilM [Phycisphaeraceae bacterium]